jgi:hypothetical protein
MKAHLEAMPTPRRSCLAETGVDLGRRSADIASRRVRLCPGKRRDG